MGQPPYTSGDNGNVFTIANNRDSTRTEAFTYDSLNRISTAQSKGSQWGESFTIDSWGNMTKETPISGKTNHENLSTTAPLPNNQLSGFGYDAAGNMTSNGSVNYVYDGENRLIWTRGLNPTPTRYIYDGDGVRVEKCAAATVTTACPTSGTTGTLYWRGTSAEPQAETDLSGNVLENYIFFGGQRIARRDGSTKAVHFYFSDQVGSHGVVENATGTACEQDIDYYPYGGQENDYCANVAQHYKFNGKERDTESGLDNFEARYDASSLGRFMTADWAAKPTAVPYAHYGNPQSLNLYSFTINNPTTFGDPDGHNRPGADGGLTPDGQVSNCGNNQQQCAFQNAQQAQNQSQTKQLTADDVSKGIKAFDSDKDDKNPGRVVKALDTMGKDFTVSGDTLKQGVKDSGVTMPKAADKVLANVDSITRTGDKVVITNKGSMTIDLLGQIGKTISFTINESVKGKSGYQGPELQNLKGVGIGLGPFATHP